MKLHQLEDNDMLSRAKKLKREIYSWGQPNPLGGSGIVMAVMDGDDDALINIDVGASSDGLYIGFIGVLEGKTGRGYGDYVLKEITDLADEMDVRLFLTAHPIAIAGKKIPKAKLVQFYKKHGFTGPAERMEREPK